MPNLAVYQVKINLPPDVFAALEGELKSALSSGLFGIGPAIFPPEALYLMWVSPGDICVTATAPGSSFADADGARKVARAFVAKWRARAD